MSSFKGFVENFPLSWLVFFSWLALLLWAVTCLVLFFACPPAFVAIFGWVNAHVGLYMLGCLGGALSFGAIGASIAACCGGSDGSSVTEPTAFTTTTAVPFGPDGLQPVYQPPGQVAVVAQKESGQQVGGGLFAFWQPQQPQQTNTFAPGLTPIYVGHTTAAAATNS